MDQGYLNTKEFADLVGVTKHTLFHYDQVGIFCPAHRGENGYRYYSLSQTEPFYVIQVLKELGMSLSEIRSYMDSRSPERFMALMRDQGDRIEDRIQRLVAMKKLVESKMEVTSLALAADRDGISVEMSPNRPLLLSPASCWSDERAAFKLLMDHVRRCSDIGMALPSSIGQILDRKSVEEGRYDGYRYYYTDVDELPPRDGLVMRGGPYLVAYHCSGYLSIGEAYERLLAKVSERALQIGDLFFEDVVLDEMSVKGYHDFMVKISVELKNPASDGSDVDCTLRR